MPGKTVPAVNWSSFGWIERDFGLNTAVRTDYFRYFSGAAADTSEPPTALVSVFSPEIIWAGLGTALIIVVGIFGFR